MEQRIGTSSQPLDGAGVDPAFIPGLTSTVSGEPEDAEPGDAEPIEPRDAVPAGEAAEAREAEEGAPEELLVEEASTVDASTEEEEAPDGPVFEAADRRARIVADHSGVRLRLDDQECEFSWDEIGAVETETARFGKRFTVTVHTPERRWYPIEIEADSRSRFQEWETRLDEVLDAYFEDGEHELPTPEKDGD
ncbi:hypothetical protein [Streptomyces sp. TP-A0356]|uniref:hypothetical protein n=1 Tax=Streptomyces sp. TP-A0356 TaxID=1359208 RepID=UPI0006E25210|nr:hypothetical protein [Streptomyces sp. TP-A0356]